MEFIVKMSISHFIMDLGSYMIACRNRYIPIYVCIKFRLNILKKRRNIEQNRKMILKHYWLFFVLFVLTLERYNSRNS